MAAKPAVSGSPPPDAGGDSRLPSGSGRTSLRAVVIMNNQRNMAGALSFLERRGYQVTIFNRISDAIESLKDLKPHVVLISWNLKGVEVRKVYKLLSINFNLICIVFAEDNTTRTTAALMSSGIPHSLLAPVSGPSIHMRVQALLRTRATSDKEKERADRKKAEAELNAQTRGRKRVEINWDQLPREARWEKSVDADGSTIWKATLPSDKGKRSYFFKGTIPPVYIEREERWTSRDDKAPLIMEETADSPELSAVQEGRRGTLFNAVQQGAGRGDLMSAIQEGAAGEEMSEVQPGADNSAGFDWDAALAGASKELDEIKSEETQAEKSGPQNESGPDDPDSHENNNRPVKAPYQLEHGEMGAAPARFEESALDPNGVSVELERPIPGHESVLVQSLRAAAELCTRPAQDDFHLVSIVAHLHVIPLSTERFTGYIVCVSASDLRTSGLPARVLDEFKKQMSHRGEELAITPPVWTITVDPFDFQSWAAQKAEFVITAPDANDSACFAFVPVTTLPTTKDTQDDTVFGISVEQHLLGGMPIMFDLYLHFPKNDKYLLYLNRGAILSQSTIEKLMKFKIRTVYIRRADRDFFLAYCARNFLLSSKQS